jgi:hypothetical protein
LAIVLGLLLVAASFTKLRAETRYPPEQPWIESRFVSESASTAEAALALLLVAGVWPCGIWLATVTIFALFAIITVAGAIQGKDSCGCFGAVQVRPVYTMFLDISAVAALLVSGRPSKSGSEVVGRGSARGRWIVAGAIGIAWVGIVLGMWLIRPVFAVATTATEGQTFGGPGDLVVLEPEKWPSHRFSLADHILADHIDTGSQLLAGQWVVLLVHHDCDHCAAAVPKYVTTVGAGAPSPIFNPRPPTPDLRPPPRLAVIEMPPFGDAADPPPWQLPPSVLSGRLDQTRDWFATTPVALVVKDGIVISAKESDAAETPDPSW